MKHLVWKGNSLQTIKSFPKMVKEDIGFQLECLQQDQNPTQWQWFPSVGPDVKAIFSSNNLTYCLIYCEKGISRKRHIERVHYIKSYPKKIIYILHAFVEIEDERQHHLNLDIAREALSSIDVAHKIGN